MNAPHRDPLSSVDSSIHEQLVSWAARRAKSDHECCVLLLAAARSGVHRVLGFATAVQYGAAVTEMSTRQVRERLRVAKALESLPEISASFATGRLAYTKIRELTRVATRETESTWRRDAEQLTATSVQELCAGRVPGDLPSSPAKIEARRHRILFDDVDAEAKALLAEARRRLTEEHGEALDDSQFLRALAQHVLRSDRNPERANYQVALSECASCKTVRQRAGGQPVVVEPVIAERAKCDAQHLGDLDAKTPARATQTIPPAIRRQVLARHGSCCAVPGCRLSAFVDIHHIELRSEGGTHDPERLVPLCSNHHDMTHRGRLIISGTFSSGFMFQRADGASTQQRLSRALRKTGAFGEAYEALRALGFKSAEAERMLDAVRETHADESVENVVRAALRARPVRTYADHRSGSRVSEHRPRYSRTTPRGWATPTIRPPSSRNVQRAPG